MRHFIGGWAAGTFICGTYICFRAKTGTQLIDAFIWAGVVLGPLVGLAVWGLWP